MVGQLIFGIPAYNEEKRIENVLRGVSSLPGSPRILVVDDGSTDRTAEAVERWPEVRLVRHPENRGLAEAQTTLLREFLASPGTPDDVLIFVHADGAMDVSEVDRFVRRFEQTGADVVLGSRLLWWRSNLRARGGFRTLMDMMATLLENVAFRTWLTSYGSGFRAWKRRAVERLDLDALRSRGASFDVEIVALAVATRLAIAEVPVRAVPRLRPSSYLLTTYSRDVLGVIARYALRRWTGFAPARRRGEPVGGGARFGRHGA